MLALVLAAAAGPAAAAEPLPVRNLSPATQIFGLPSALGRVLESETTQVTLNLEHGNNFTSDTSAGALVYFDGSTTVLGLGLRRGFAQRFEAGIEVPWVRHDGGITDGLIEGFHDLTGLPGGGREDVPRDRIDYRIDYAGEAAVRVDDNEQHLGDVRAWLGYRLSDAPGRSLALRAMVELPTGRLEDLSGSGATDVALWLELLDGRLLEAAGIEVSVMGGVTLPGDGDLAASAQRDAVVSGHLGLHYPLSGRFTLHAQLDAHSDVLRTGVPQLAEGAVQGTLGTTVALSSSTWLDLALHEDLTSRSAPDAVFQLRVGGRF